MNNGRGSLPKVVSQEEWLKARRKLLAREKELTHAHDRLSTERRRLPMVRVTKDYEFEGPGGRVGLPDLFEGRRQLIIYHFMFDPEWEEGCRSCSAWVDQVARGHLHHLHTRTTTLALVSRAPLDRIEPFRKRMGWDLPWYSSFGSDFNYDFHVTQDESVQPVQYNYRDRATLDHLGQEFHTRGEQPGLSCFLRTEQAVYHTYSTYGRGLEQVGGVGYFLDLTALGRQEEWEEPKGRSTGLGAPAGSERLRYPDEYEQ